MQGNLATLSYGSHNQGAESAASISVKSKLVDLSRVGMPRSRKTRKFIAAAVASLAIHGVALTGLAVTFLPGLQKQILVVQHTPFAGQQVALAMSIARPDVHVPPPPDIVPAESPVMVTPHEAQLEHHIYIDKQSAEVAAQATTVVRPVDVAEILLPAQPVADREAQTAPAEDSQKVQPTAAVAKATRAVMPSTASVAVPPQTVGSDRRPARMHNNRPPRYPDIARQNRWEGTVLLRLSIDAQGRVTNVEVARSSGYPVLDAEAAAAVRIWRGEPAMVDGVAVPSEENLPVRFRMQ